MKTSVLLLTLTLSTSGALLILDATAVAQSLLDDDPGVSHFLAQSLVQNGTFDIDVSSWSAAPSGVSSFVWDPLDANSSPTSGSGLLSNFNPVAEEHVWATQCLIGQGVAGVEYLISGEIYIPSGQVETGSAFLRLAWYEGTACFGTDFLGTVLTSAVTSATPDTWTLVQTTGTAVPGTLNLQVRLFAKKDQANGNFDAQFDNIIVATVGIFQDGFESGDTSAWSNTVP